MRIRTGMCVLGGLIWGVACGDDGDSERGDAGGANVADTGVPDAGGGSSTSSAACDCKPSEACLRVKVELDSQSPELPWKLWPEQNLGEGRLFVGVYGPAAGSTVKSDDVKLSSSFEAKSYNLCVTPSANMRAFCFLDDKADGMLTPPGTSVTGSGNYRDTCSKERQLPVSLSADAVQSLTCTLANSCD